MHVYVSGQLVPIIFREGLWDGDSVGFEGGFLCLRYCGCLTRCRSNVGFSGSCVCELVCVAAGCLHVLGLLHCFWLLVGCDGV